MPKQSGLANSKYNNPTKILVVEDDPDLLNELCEIIESDNRDVVACPSPLFALRYLHINRLDVLITDYRMPVLDGVQLARVVLEIYPDTHVVIMSGLPVRTMIPDTWYFMNKPIDIRQLESHLDTRKNPSSENVTGS